MIRASTILSLVGCVALSTGLLSSGCGSARHKIIEQSAIVQREAQSTKEILTQAIILLGNHPVVPSLQGALAHQETILRASSVVVEQTAFVEDKTPWWATMVGRVAIAGSVLGVIFLIWHLGIGTLIKRAVWAVGLLIPKPTRTSAAFDVAAVEQGTASASRREAIAARRAADRAYDKAYNKEKKKARLTSSQPPPIVNSPNATHHPTTPKGPP